MIYRTLHVYILRELLRVFLMTASALTTLLAFGGMFKPLTRQGIDIGQVMVLMFNLMPAMLAYAIPIAALSVTNARLRTRLSNRSRTLAGRGRSILAPSR